MNGYVAFGTPFTGELAKLGENVSAPIAALYLLAQGPENRIDPIAPGEAARSLLANVLFFAKDEELVQATFHSAFRVREPGAGFAAHLCARCPGLGVDWMSRLYVARNPRVAARSLDGEMMIMSAAIPLSFTLNKTATILWQAADGTTPLDEIVEQRICTEFEVEPAEALQDAETLARELASHEILQISEEPISATHRCRSRAGESR